MTVADFLPRPLPEEVEKGTAVAFIRPDGFSQAVEGGGGVAEEGGHQYGDIGSPPDSINRISINHASPCISRNRDQEGGRAEERPTGRGRNCEAESRARQKPWCSLVPKTQNVIFTALLLTVMR